MPEPMKWERIKVAPMTSKKDRQPSAVFRAKAPGGWFVAFEWGNGVADTIFVAGDTWDVELEED